MQNKNSKKARSRAEILAEIASLPPSVQGTISSYTNVRKNGTKVVYHNLQYTHGGRHRSFAIPVDKVDEFKAAVAAGKKLKELVLELSCANAEEIASSGSPLKKRALLQIVENQFSCVAATRPNTALALLRRARSAGHPAARLAA